MTATRFEGDGPVARYWLANCEGFAVRGGAHGVVEELIRDANPHVTTRLVVRTRSRRRRVMGVDTVAAVDPARRVITVERARRLPARAPSVDVASGERAVAVLRRGIAAAGPPVRHVLAAVRVGLSAARPPASRALAAVRAGAAQGVEMLFTSLLALAAEADATARALSASATARRAPRVRRSRGGVGATRRARPR